jgi:UDP-N-acetylmuramate dehydrogenase
LAPSPGSGWAGRGRAVHPGGPDDLADFLKALDRAVPVMVLGVGSNVIVRDGGVEGVVIRLAGRPFAGITTDGDTITAGAGALDAMVAKASARAGTGRAGILCGHSGHDRRRPDDERRLLRLGNEGHPRLGLGTDAGRGAGRLCAGRLRLYLPPFRGAGRHHLDRGRLSRTPDAPEAVAARIAEITARRETTQPIREKTGGSTFKNPPGHSSWKLVDEAGWRGRLHAVTGGGAMFSDLHSNFMINPGEATAADIEGLGEAVRADVLTKIGVQLDWEIKRIGRPTGFR